MPGGRTPTALLISPISLNGVTHAVFRFAFSRRLESADQEFLSHASEALAVAMRSSKDRTLLVAQQAELLRTNLHLEEQMRILQQQKLELSLFNSANFSCIATDAKGVIQIFNVGAERMLGYAAEEVVNKITPADISDSQES